MSATATAEEPDARRLQILRAALDVIVERGYPATRIADIAERVGVSPALVVYYFKSKELLLAEAMRLAEDVWYAESTRRIERIPTAAGRLEELVRLTCLPHDGIGLAEDSPSLWIDLWSQSIRRPEIRSVREEFDGHWRKTVGDVVRYGRDRGELGDVDPDDAAIALCALLDGLSVQIALRDPVVGEERAFSVAMGFASVLLGFPWGRATRRRRRRGPPLDPSGSGA